MTFTLCGTCRKAVVSYETPSMLPGLPAHVEWVHYVRADIGDPWSGDHDAVPSESIRERILYCAACRRRQVYGYAGWYCANDHCPSRVDKD